MISLAHVVGTLLDPEKLRGTPYEQYCSRLGQCIDPTCVEWSCPRRGCKASHKKGRSHCGHRSRLHVDRRSEIAEETIGELRPYSSPLIDDKLCLFGRFHSVVGDPDAEEIPENINEVREEIQAIFGLTPEETYVRRWSVYAVLPHGYAIEDLEDADEEDDEDDDEAELDDEENVDEDDGEAEEEEDEEDEEEEEEDEEEEEEDEEEEDEEGGEAEDGEDEEEDEPVKAREETPRKAPRRG